MKKVNITYWIFTGLLCVLMTFSAIPDVANDPKAIEFISGHLKYPEYIVPFIGVAKLLAVIAILIPGFPRVKEWAYAGLVFDLAGATYSSLAVGDPPIGSLFMLIGFGLIFTSYFLHHKRLKLKAASTIR